MAVGLTLMDENREQYSQFTHTWTLAHATHAPTHACTRTHALLKGKFNTLNDLQHLERRTYSKPTKSSTWCPTVTSYVYSL